MYCAAAGAGACATDLPASKSGARPKACLPADAAGPDTVVPTLSDADCCQACAATTGCHAWTMTPPSNCADRLPNARGCCYLKVGARWCPHAALPVGKLSWTIESCPPAHSAVPCQGRMSGRVPPCVPLRLPGGCAGGGRLDRNQGPQGSAHIGRAAVNQQASQQAVPQQARPAHCRHITRRPWRPKHLCDRRSPHTEGECTDAAQRPS